MAGPRATRVERLRGQERKLRQASGTRAKAAVRQDAGLPVEPSVELDLRHPRARPGATGALARAVDWANRATLVVGMIALVAASFILTFSVVSRYLFKMGTDWQDEAAVFCIVGTVFLCGAYVQSQ